MNNAYGQYPTGVQLPQSPIQQNQSVPIFQPITNTEPLYSEELLKRHIGKFAEIYASFNDSKEWNSKIFRGTIKDVGRDFVCVEESDTGKKYLIIMIYIDYVVF